jgi:hypothetical protein
LPKFGTWQHPPGRAPAALAEWGHKPGALNWWGVIPQDTQTSTYDQDPELDAQGKPTNLPLVQGKGATDLDSLPFSSLFVRDFGGQCMPSPRDLGAFSTP